MWQLCFIDIVMLQVLSTTVNDDYRAKKTRELASFFSLDVKLPIARLKLHGITGTW